MRFGNTALVSVRGGGAAPMPVLARNAMQRSGQSGPMAGFQASQVNVGRAPQRGSQRTQVRTGVVDNNGNNIGMGNQQGNSEMGGGACKTGINWDELCERPLPIVRTSIAAGATTIFTVTPCGPYQLRCLIIPESFALLFSVTQLKVCRTDYIEGGAWPAEAFTSNGTYGCLLGCGSVAFPSLPFLIGIRNDSGAAAFFSGLLYGKEASYCPV